MTGCLALNAPGSHLKRRALQARTALAKWLELNRMFGRAYGKLTFGHSCRRALRSTAFPGTLLFLYGVQKNRKLCGIAEPRASAGAAIPRSLANLWSSFLATYFAFSAERPLLRAKALLAREHAIRFRNVCSSRLHLCTRDARDLGKRHHDFASPGKHGGFATAKHISTPHSGKRPLS